MQFKNQPILSFDNPEDVSAQQDALKSTRSKLGKSYIWGDSETMGQVKSVNPYRPEELVAEAGAMTEESVSHMIGRSEAAFKKWSRTTVKERQDIMANIAAGLEKNRFEFNAWMMTETGKPWIEADADTCEAIDFVKYYSESLSNWTSNDRMVRIPGQDNKLVYIPLGVGSVIAPWNFPLAILCGMTTASLVTGNTVLMKPASDALQIAVRFHEVLMEAGVPEDVVQLVVGRGPEVGKPMVEDPRIRYICFTGSREVGVHIYQEGSKVHPGQLWLKRMMLEMGGKDGIFVDETADVTSAAQGVVAAAFGYSGQKCSACSRLIVHQDVKTELVDQVIDLTSKLRIGDPTDQRTQMGPVINRSSFDKVGKYIDIGSQEGKKLYGGEAFSDQGYTWQPTIIDNIVPNHQLFQDEIFGPVLGITTVNSFEQGIEYMNATEYGLTGAVYTSEADRIAKAKAEVFVGNLYINKKCTGAFVGQHPFGGFNMSGTDSKAGGPDYLLQFLQPKCITEAV